MFLYKQSFTSLKCTLTNGFTPSALNFAIQSSKLCSGMFNVKSDVITSSCFLSLIVFHFSRLLSISALVAMSNNRFSSLTFASLVTIASTFASFLGIIPATCILCSSSSAIVASYSAVFRCVITNLVSSFNLSAFSSNTSFLMKLWPAILL